MGSCRIGVERIMLLALGASGLMACAPDLPPSGTGPTTPYELRGLVASGDGGGYETVPPLVPEKVLSPDLVASDHHEVRLVRCVEGHRNRYLVETRRGQHEIDSTGILRKRVYEAKVLDELEDQEIAAEKVYGLAVLNASTNPVEGASQLIFHPIRTIPGIPKGLWAYARLIYEMKERDRTHLEDDYAAELMGFGKAKREWAYRLGVDPYSENTALQDVLNRYGWVSLAGGMTVRAPLMAVSGPASYALTVTSTTDDMKRELRDLAPEDVRISNRGVLRDFGVDEQTIEAFLGHPWYSPSRQVALLGALQTLEGVSGRERFVSLSLAADDTMESFEFARRALLLAGYNEFVDPITRIGDRRGLAIAWTQGGDLVVPVYVDVAFWTEGIARFVDEIDAALADEAEAMATRRRIAVVSGRFSERAREEMQARGWSLMEGLEFTWLAEFDGETYRPGKPDADRIIPEFGG